MANVGDVRMAGGKRVTVIAAVPDMNGEIVVQTDDGYYVPIGEDQLSPIRETVAVTAPWGTGRAERPVNGERETRVVWDTVR